MTDIVERLDACENDPMWADHAEVPKSWCREAKDEIERLREALQLWYDACTVDAKMTGPVVRVSHTKAQRAWLPTCAALEQKP